MTNCVERTTVRHKSLIFVHTNNYYTKTTLLRLRHTSLQVRLVWHRPQEVTCIFRPINGDLRYASRSEITVICMHAKLRTRSLYTKCCNVIPDSHNETKQPLKILNEVRYIGGTTHSHSHAQLSVAHCHGTLHLRQSYGSPVELGRYRYLKSVSVFCIGIATVFLRILTLIC